MPIELSRDFEFDDSHQAFESFYDLLVRGGFTGSSSRPDTYQFTRNPEELVEITLSPDGIISIHTHDGQPDGGRTLMDEVDDILNQSPFTLEGDYDQADGNKLGDLRGLLGGKLLAVIFEVLRSL